MQAWNNKKIDGHGTNETDVERDNNANSGNINMFKYITRVFRFCFTFFNGFIFNFQVRTQ